jgi:hypothetical protein
MKNHLLSLICILLFSSNSKAVNLLAVKELIPITVTMKDGQIKKGKVKDNLDPDKKIALILEDGSVETLASENVKEFTIEGQNGALITYENVAYFKNTKRKDIASKSIFMMILMRDPAPIAMYYQLPWQIAYDSGAAASMYNTTNFYAQRKGEPAATLLSSVMMGQVNPNAVFKDVAPDYFSDYPELARKIENKTYTYEDIMTVALEYTKWKTGDDTIKENKK